MQFTLKQQFVLGTRWTRHCVLDRHRQFARGEVAPGALRSGRVREGHRIQIRSLYQATNAADLHGDTICIAPSTSTGSSAASTSPRAQTVQSSWPIGGSCSAAGEAARRPLEAHRRHSEERPFGSFNVFGFGVRHLRNPQEAKKLQWESKQRAAIVRRWGGRAHRPRGSSG